MVIHRNFQFKQILQTSLVRSVHSINIALCKGNLGYHNIKGITVNNDIIKLGQNAEDTFLFLDGSEQSIVLNIENFTNFQKCFGLKIYIENTVAIQMCEELHKN